MINPESTLVCLIVWLAERLGVSFDLGQRWEIDPLSDEELNDQLHHGRSD